MKTKNSKFDFEKTFTGSLEISDISKISKVSLSTALGSIRVSYNSGNTAIINATYNVRANAENDFSTIEKNVVDKDLERFVKLKNNILKLKVSAFKGNPKFNVSTYIEISLPTHFSDFNTQVNTGSIDLDGLQGVFNLECDTGSITANNVKFTGNSKLAVSAGTVVLSLSEQEPDNSEVEVRAKSGEIIIGIGTLPFEKTADSSPEDSTFNSRQFLVISKKCKINASVNNGRIQIE